MPLSAAADEGDVLNFIVGYSITYDDNLFRLPSDPAPGQIVGVTSRSDTIQTGILGFTLDKPVARQRFLVDASFNSSRFSENSRLNYDGHNLRGRWLWELGNRWKGEVGAEATRTLQSFADIRVAAKDLIDYRRFYGSANYWYHPEWSAFVGASSADSTNSSELLRANDYRADYLELGLRFVPPTGNQIALKVRHTDGSYPNRDIVVVGNLVLSTVDKSYVQDDLELSTDWRPTGESHIVARVAWTSRRNENLPERDFSGPTGRLLYDWAVTGKTALNLTLFREIGATDELTAAYVVSNGISVTPTWTPTAKVSVQGTLSYILRDYQDDPGFVIAAGPQREDRVRTASLTTTYLPLRSLQLSLTLQKQRRSSNIPSNEYDDNLAIGSAQFTF